MRSMKKVYIIKFFCYLLILFISFSTAKAQVDSSKSSMSNDRLGYWGANPCYIFLHSQKLFNLPDSLSLKKYGEMGTFIVTILFDSSSNLIDIIPVSIYINKKADKSFRKDYSFYGIDENKRNSENFSRSEAMAFVDWAEKTVPATIKISKLPYKCNKDEKRSAVLWYPFEFKIE